MPFRPAEGQEHRALAELMRIGCRADNEDPYICGLVDELQIYDHALTPEEVQKTENRPTENLQALEYYLRSNSHFARRRSSEDADQAAHLYQMAVEEDPNFSLAWAGLSMAHSARQWMHGGGSEATRAAQEAADSSLKLDPSLPEAHLAKGYTYYYASRDFEAALREFELARLERPNNPDVREYLLALFGDLAANYDIDYLQTCQYLFTPLDLDQGGG